MNTPALLAQEILKAHNTSALHLSSVPVRMELVDDRIWDGVVEIFWLTSHAETKTAYAWTETPGDAEGVLRHIIVLHIPPVDSPQTAVRHAMMN